MDVVLVRALVRALVRVGIAILADAGWGERESKTGLELTPERNLQNRAFWG